MASIKELQDYIKRQKRVIQELNVKLRQKEALLELHNEFEKFESVLKPTPNHHFKYFMMGLACGALLMVLILSWKL